MGYSYWNDQAFESRQDQRRRTKKSAFTYDAHVRTSGIKHVHHQMDPFGAVRESRDSAQHPDSVAIAVIFDVTGSMGAVPRVLQSKLGSLMRLLLEKNYVAHPQLLFGGVGDAYCDAVPLQIGQFESGLEMDDELGKIYLEGGGGGQVHESYELAYYFAARHTSLDCYEQRGHKGYLFTIGDEKPYPAVNRQQVAELCGDTLNYEIPTQRIVAEAIRKYECFHIIPTNTAHGQSREVQECWRALLGERVLLLENEAAVCETIALAIGLCEGSIFNLHSGRDDLHGAGYDQRATECAANALVRYAQARAA